MHVFVNVCAKTWERLHLNLSLLFTCLLLPFLYVPPLNPGTRQAGSLGRFLHEDAQSEPSSEQVEYDWSLYAASTLHSIHHSIYVSITTYNELDFDEQLARRCRIASPVHRSLVQSEDRAVREQWRHARFSISHPNVLYCCSPTVLI